MVEDLRTAMILWYNISIHTELRTMWSRLTWLPWLARCSAESAIHDWNQSYYAKEDAETNAPMPSTVLRLFSVIDIFLPTPLSSWRDLRLNFGSTYRHPRPHDHSTSPKGWGLSKIWSVLCPSSFLPVHHKARGRYSETSSAAATQQWESGIARKYPA